MLRKGSFITIIILLAGLSVIIYRMKLNDRASSADPLEMIPVDAALLIESSDLPSLVFDLSGGSGTLASLAETTELTSFFTLLADADSLLNTETIRPFVAGKESAISYHFKNGKGELLLVIRSGKHIGKKRFGELLLTEKIIGAGAVPVEGVYSSLSGDFFIALHNGLIMCGSSSEIIARAIEQNSTGVTIRDVRGFTSVSSAAGRDSDRIYFFFEGSSALMSERLSGSTGLNAKFSELALCTEGDIHIRENGVLINGYTATIEGKGLDRFQASKPESYETFRVLPASTILYEAMVNVPVKRTVVPDLPASGLAADLIPLLGEEITFALIKGSETNSKGNGLMIYELISGPSVFEFMKSHFAKNFEGAVESDYTIYFEPDDQGRIAVYKWENSGLGSMLAPDFEQAENDTYLVVYDNYLVTSSSLTAVNRFLYDNILRKTLANDVNYRNFESFLPSRGSYYFFCIPSEIGDYLTDHLTEKTAATVGSLTNIEAFGYQLSPGNEMLYSSLAFTIRNEVREESETEWQTMLDTVAYTKPYFFTNHNTGAREIFVQDYRNNIYLINSSGRVLWKAPVRERIVSGINMIDYYRNGKLQLLFSGSDYIHLIDRNGNYVDGFPVKMSVTASGPLSLFDYENNRDYRLVVPGTDRNIYVYDKSGDPVKGWKPFKTAGLVTGEIKFFRVSGKDYIVICDDRGVYFLDRRGNVRLNIKEQIVKAVNSEIALESGRTPAIVFSSPDGTVNRIPFNGDVERIKTASFSADHSFSLFDIDSNGEEDFIFLSGGVLTAYTKNGRVLFETNVGVGKVAGPFGFNFGPAENMVGVVNISRQKIYLVDGMGNNLKGFPLKGGTPFSIGKLTDRPGYNLIVGSNDRFLYNYRINK